MTGSRSLFSSLVLVAACADQAWASIRGGVEAYSGAEQLERWDQHSAWNGVD